MELITFYNITKAKRALWLVNLASTICPWVYAADVCANVYKANILTEIVSKIMADIPSAKNAKLSSQLSEEETEYPSFDLFGSIFAEPPAKRFASLSESDLDDLVSERHSKKTKEVTNWSVSTFKGKQQVIKA